MKGLRTLIRLNQWQLDQKRRELASLEQLLSELRGRAVQLESEIVAEQAVAAGQEVVRFAYAGFARAAIAQREKIALSIAEVGERIKTKHAEVTEAFHEYKRYEPAARAPTRRAVLAEARREQADLDEIAINAHRRKTAEEAR